MNDLDRVIRESLSAEDAELLESLGADQSLHRQILTAFEGRLRWLNAIGSLMGLLLFVLACIAAWEFIQSENMREMLRWIGASALLFAGVVLIKVWFWMEFQKNAVVREIRRLEVQVAGLASELRRGR